MRVSAHCARHADAKVAAAAAGGGNRLAGGGIDARAGEIFEKV